VLAILAETETLLGGDARPWASEALRMAEDTGQVRHAAHARGLLAFDAAIRGEHTTADGDWAERARALLDLGDGHFEAALERLESLQHRPYALHFLPDQIEAAVRAGRRDRAPLGRFEAWARTANQPWALAAAHRCRALLAEQPEEHFEQAVQCADLPWQQARSRLVYGEWLRRERRKNEARAQLREALESFEKAGAKPWADHARAELRAAGESVTPAAGDLRAALTPQELQIVRLAATGATNKEIGAQLFLSPKTVGHHLYRAFPKLGVSNRTELARLMG
ncbi:MAG: helix-turn-helix transcriptional regulator, partial [Thermoactinospora sp.]|nr:helix-turn-helix transcriptional regulator [Thermoactinospora sp.]